jgi:hypothetical protein
VSSGLILTILPAVIRRAKALVYGWHRLDSAGTRNIIFLPSTVILEPQAIGEEYTMNPISKIGLALLAGVLLLALGLPAAAQSPGTGSRLAPRESLPIRDPPFKGKIGKTYKESKAA